MKNKPTIVNAVIGYPLLHTRSPVLHAAAYRALGIDAEMVPFSDPDIRKLLTGIRALPIRLVAVTMPFKTSVMPFLDRIEAQAKSVNAVNTILKTGGRLLGYNTDVDGIRYTLRNTRLKGKRVLLVGAGGGARAVASVVSHAGGELMYLNRTPKKASMLAKDFGGRIVRAKGLRADDIDVIVNATPIGMHPKTARMSVPERLIARHQTVFDLVYNPILTHLLKAAKRKGATTASGLDMFVVQGLRQTELMSGLKVITPAFVARMKKVLLKTNL